MDTTRWIELTRVTDAAGNVTSISYDGFGRKTAMTDPDMGSWSYSYDAVGNLVQQTDAKSQVIEFGYDKLNRLVRKWYPPAWNSAPGSSGSGRSLLFDLIELRATIDANRAAAGLSAATWTDPEPTGFSGNYLAELYNRINELWVAAGIGSVPGVPSGSNAAFLDTLRSWIYHPSNTSYESSTWAASAQSQSPLPIRRNFRRLRQGPADGDVGCRRQFVLVLR